MMQKFCRKCGQKLDKKTGLCPNCDNNLTKKEIKIIKKTRKKTAKLNAKKEKWQRLTLRQRIKKICKRFILTILAIMIVVGSTVFVWKHYDHEDIPIVKDIVGKIDDLSTPKRSIPETNTSGLKYHTSSEENIVTDSGVIYVNNEIIVVLQSEHFKPDLEMHLNSVGGKIVGYVDVVAEYQILLNKAYSYAEINELAKTFEMFDWVVYASPNYAMKLGTSYVPNDKKWKNKWDKIPEGSNWGMEAIEAPDAWEYKNQLSSVNIGVIDNMFDINHKDLNFAEKPLGQQLTENAISEKKLKWNNHGTHTSGTIAALFDNDEGVSGGSLKTNLYGVSSRGLETSEYYTTHLYNVAFAYLIHEKHCSVINISMGYDQMTFEASRNQTYAIECINSFASGIERFLKLLIDQNYQFVICKAAGNQNEVGGGYKYFRKDDDDENTPFSYYSYTEYEEYLGGDKTNETQFSRYKKRKREIKKKLESGNVDAKYDFLGAISSKEVKDRIIVVGSVKSLGTKRTDFFSLFGEKVHKGYKIAASSQCGNRVDILAPGVDIYSTIKNGYGEMSGTSMAAPHVAAVAGLVFSANPNLRGEQVKKIICDTAVGSYGREGYGLLNAKNAVEMALQHSNNDSIDEKNNAQQPIRTTSDERDIVLVLDVSGSMSGKPIEETKKASTNFINTILKENASIGVVTYDNSAEMLSDFSVDEQSLKSIVSSINDGGGTNIESGLAKAEEMLNTSNAKKKIIVLMSDGEPNDGKVGDELIAYANDLKKKGTYIYTLGFFESMGSGKSSAQDLMEKIASDGCHYEVADADDLKFFFGDIADQINGQKYIYVRIACPVDVSVEYDGEVLRSSGSNPKTRTSFGSLTFEDSSGNHDDSKDDRTKILRLKDNADYNIKINGNGTGTMDYTIGFMDENGEYGDLRDFNGIEISKQTKVETTAKNSPNTTLKVDSDGDGKYDITYKAEANSEGKIVDYRYIIFIVIAIVVLILLLIMYLCLKKMRRTFIMKHKQKLAQKKRFCVYCGNFVPGDKTFCTKCGRKVE